VEEGELVQGWTWGNIFIRAFPAHLFGGNARKVIAASHDFVTSPALLKCSSEADIPQVIQNVVQLVLQLFCGTGAAAPGCVQALCSKLRVWHWLCRRPASTWPPWTGGP
jgi:hypothetical protein